ncbi:E3 ubiquitin ligase TRAF3IP2 [Amia ocellicauda]|uniref:E3 ubiquitin ligase TRAF3IP2 n=1 Tax=Amia ocellicauda TaxID=2972642 RepID=UPI003464E526
MMMSPAPYPRTVNRYMSPLVSGRSPTASLNSPEENDETVSDDSLPSLPSHPCASPQSHSPLSSLDPMTEGAPCRAAAALHCLGPYQPRHGLDYGRTAPFPVSVSLNCPDRTAGAWLPPSFSSSGCGSGGGYPNTLASGEYSGYPGQDCYPIIGHQAPSLSPSSHSFSLNLDPPQSLRSIPPLAATGHNPYLTPYHCWPRGPTCCVQCPGDRYCMAPSPQHRAAPGYHLPGAHPGPAGCPHPDTGSTQSAYTPNGLRKENYMCNTALSLEQRKVFVTYEADSDKHVHEIIQFVALLRRNGFDTRIDVFEQQFKSISKIDFMEKYISEKDYLIIIVISPKYHETVTSSHIALDKDENTLNTVYIHKQLQNEFIQNGSKNFRFIPILFPGAKKCHVPTWLQNTHVYSWPKDRDDILRRLMRVEKYNPPPIGKLPTIVSIPI